MSYEPYEMVLARARLAHWLSVVKSGREQVKSNTFPRTTHLSDGTTGFYMRPDRGDDCWQAATATVLQVPIDEVPDLRLNARVESGEHPDKIARSAWHSMEDWLNGHGLCMVVHRKVPVARRRWIGVVPCEGDFQSHSLVMTRDDLLFDPAERIWGSGGRYTPEHIGFGLSFQQLSNHN